MQPAELATMANIMSDRATRRMASLNVNRSPAVPGTQWLTSVLRRRRNPGPECEPHFRGCWVGPSRGDASAGTGPPILSPGTRRAQPCPGFHGWWDSRHRNGKENLISPYFMGLGTPSTQAESWKSYEDFMGFSPLRRCSICCGPGHRGDGGIGPAAPPFAGCRRTVLNSPDRLARVPRRNMPRDQLHGEANSARTSRISAIPPRSAKAFHF